MPAPDFSRLRRSATCALVFDAEGRVLLHRRTDNGHWALPGGAVEVGERADQTIVREVKEETGYDVEAVRLVGIYSDPQQTTITYPNGDVSAYVALAFECRVIGGRPETSDETAAVGFFSSDALPEPFYAPHLQRLQDARARSASAFFR